MSIFRMLDIRRRYDGQHPTLNGVKIIMSTYWDVGSSGVRVYVIEGWNVRDFADIDYIVRQRPAGRLHRHRQKWVRPPQELEEEEWREYDEEVQQFRELMLQCGADPASSSSRFVLDDESPTLRSVSPASEGTPPSQEGLEESELSLEEGSSLLTEAQVRAFLQSQFGSEGEGSSPASSTQASGPKEGNKSERP
eukprot:s661_g7.t1